MRVTHIMPEEVLICGRWIPPSRFFNVVARFVGWLIGLEHEHTSTIEMELEIDFNLTPA